MKLDSVGMESGYGRAKALAAASSHIRRLGKRSRRSLSCK